MHPSELRSQTDPMLREPFLSTHACEWDASKAARKKVRGMNALPRFSTMHRACLRVRIPREGCDERLIGIRFSSVASAHLTTPLRIGVPCI